MNTTARNLREISSVDQQIATEAQPRHSNVRRLRLLARRKCRMPAFLKSDDRALAIEIRNISIGGVGISFAADLPAGTSVTLHMLDGRCLSGKLQWHRLGFAGVEFDSALQSDDPLLVSQDNPAPTEPRQANAQPVLAKVFSFAASVKNTLHERHKRTRDHAMLEAACRKQGYSWLIDEDDGRPKLPE